MIRHTVRFAGAGGDSQGAVNVPGIDLIWVANHNQLCVETHAANFPNVDHYCGDIVKADITRFPYGELAWDSPACPPWTDARGKKRDFDRSNQQIFPGMDGGGPDEQTMRARALMEEIPRHLRHWVNQGRPVLAGVVENVVQVRKWDDWDRWITEIRNLGYDTRVIAFNSMHARPPRSRRAPQSRDRAYVAYWHRSLGRRPDWDKWLRPRAHCPGCDQTVNALQVFKKPGADMGRYGRHGQYTYKCPRHSCRGRTVEPEALPALVAIDWSIPGKRIGDRTDPIADATIARIRAGIRRYAAPLLTPCGGTWRDKATPIDEPMATRTTRENDALAIPPLLIPMEGRPGKTAAPASARTQTARNETGLAWLPFLAELRGGSCDARAVTERMATITASGNHLFLCTPEDPPAAMVMRNNTSKGDGAEMCTPVNEPLRTMTTKGHQSLVTWDHLLVPYYGNGRARPVAEPIGALSTRDRYALVGALDEIDIADVLLRMLEPHEIGAAMAFGDDYIVLGNKRDKVRQYGNAVTPPVAELIVSALVECITGEALEMAA